MANGDARTWAGSSRDAWRQGNANYEQNGLEKAGGKYGRIDVENPNPGQRPGQIHYQEGDKKYLYDPGSGTFPGAPKAVNEILQDPQVQSAIEKALKILGE